MPYHLAQTSDVTLTIYSAKGVVVRQLDMGRQPAGFYTDRTKAAYWDGCNENGESVASGIYFYQLCARRLHRHKTDGYCKVTLSPAQFEIQSSSLFPYLLWISQFTVDNNSNALTLGVHQLTQYNSNEGNKIDSPIR